jgi:hypothetical protein
VTIDEARGGVGRQVVYLPFGGGRPEVGEITEVRGAWVFVRYFKDAPQAEDGRGPAKATSPVDLQFLSEIQR